LEARVEVVNTFAVVIILGRVLVEDGIDRIVVDGGTDLVIDEEVDEEVGNTLAGAVENSSLNILSWLNLVGARVEFVCTFVVVIILGRIVGEDGIDRIVVDRGTDLAVVGEDAGKTLAGVKGNSSLNICCFFNFKDGALVFEVIGIVDIVTSLEIVVVARVEGTNNFVVVIILGRVVDEDEIDRIVVDG